LITAALAAWAGYDRPASLAKLWLLVGAVALFYALVRQPPANFWLVTAFLSGAGAAVAIYFLLAHNWRLRPADLGFINSLGLVWMALRPSLDLQPPQPNIAGGLLALFAPFNLALLAQARKIRNRTLSAYALVAGGLVALGLLMASSRAAWLALGLGLGVWLLWQLSGRLSKKSTVPLASQPVIFAAGLLLTGLLLTGLVLFTAMATARLFLTPGGLEDWLNRLPGPDSAPSRLDIYAGTLRLVRDFPYTGGGLHAFSGLYSHYILGIPFFMFNYAHTMVLDLAVEQGLPGLLAFLCILSGGIWLLLIYGTPSELGWATFTSTLVLLLHGLVDDPLYASRGTPFLFFLPALSVAISSRPEVSRGRSPERSRPIKTMAAIALIVVVLAASTASIASMASTTSLNSRRPLASWYANIGAVHMAQVELADFPSGRWQDGSQVPALADAEALLERAFEIDPENLTASYRLGLIAMLRRDYATAQIHLKRAYIIDPKHPGVRKSLGYSYAWMGDFVWAKELLAGIPGIRAELEAYVWWWRDLGRPDLAERAKGMIRMLGGEQ
jgi:O-antigen ligase